MSIMTSYEVESELETKLHDCYKVLNFLINTNENVKMSIEGDIYKTCLVVI